MTSSLRRQRSYLHGGKSLHGRYHLLPGNGYPQMAERAAKLWKAGFAPYVLPSGKYSTAFGEFSGVLDKKEEYQGTFSTEWEFLREVLVKNGVPDYAI